MEILVDKLIGIKYFNKIVVRINFYFFHFLMKIFSLSNMISSCFWAIVVVIWSINIFWGNDPGFGVFLVILSFLYFPLFSPWIIKKIWTSFGNILKILLGICILWAALGVGELWDKIDLMIWYFHHFI